MELFDAHADTISELINQGKNFKSNDLHIDAKRLAEYTSYTQIFAAFIAPEFKDCAMGRAKSIIKKFYDEAEKNNLTVCKSFQDWENAKTKLKVFLSLEGGEPIKSLADLHHLYKLGVRMIALTWNFKNDIACGVLEETDTGLTEFGKTVICEMNKLGIIIDISHLSEKSFWDVCKNSKKPVCASHSNLKSVKDNPRNLTDEQFAEIIKCKGVIGINFYPPFFGDDISEIVRHTDKCIALGGEDNVGLGSDFDGVGRLPFGICGVQDMEKVVKMLPYSTEIREKIAFRNFLRVIKAHNC